MRLHLSEAIPSQLHASPVSSIFVTSQTLFVGHCGLNAAGLEVLSASTESVAACCNNGSNSHLANQFKQASERLFPDSCASFHSRQAQVNATCMHACMHAPHIRSFVHGHHHACLSLISRHAFKLVVEAYRLCSTSHPPSS